MKRHIIILTLLMGFFLFMPAPAGLAQTSNNDPWKAFTEADLEEQGVGQELLNHFVRLAYFIEQANSMEPNPVCSSFENAVAYLRIGFTEELAVGIVETYSYWDPVQGKLAIIPQESIPIISKNDINLLTFIRISENTFIFQRYYYNCYVTAYDDIYQITVQNTDGTWKITHLSLQSVPSPWLEDEMETPPPLTWPEAKIKV